MGHPSVAFVLFCVTLTWTLVISSPISADGDDIFANFTLLRIFPSTESQVELVRGLQDKVDLWNYPNNDFNPVLADVSPQTNDNVEATLKSSGVKYEVVTKDLQALFDRELVEVVGPQRLSGIGVGGFNMETYHQYNEIVEFLKKMSSHYGQKAVVHTIGYTTEKRPIALIEISNGDGKQKPVVMLECGIHAREWVSTATCLWIANDLLKSKLSILDKYTFHILPSANPDGYVYTWTRNRVWRKTRSLSKKVKGGFGGGPFGGGIGRECVGADPNRNFDAVFGGPGTSDQPCDDIYAGDGPFSEPESRAIRDHVLKNKDVLKAYFGIHSYTQLWMYPYGYSHKIPSNQAELVRLATLAVKAIKDTYGEDYRHGNIASAIYPASGASVDWVVDNSPCKIAYAIELRDKGQYGFRLPPQLIKPTAIEAWNGIKAVVENM